MSASVSHVAPSTRCCSKTPLWKPPLYYITALFAYERFEPKLPHKSGHTSTKTLNRKNRLMINDTLLKHGKMENRMNRSQLPKKFQFIANLTNLLQHFIGTHKTRTQLPFITKSNHTFIRQNFQIHLITFCKL